MTLAFSTLWTLTKIAEKSVYLTILNSCFYGNFLHLFPLASGYLKDVTIRIPRNPRNDRNPSPAYKIRWILHIFLIVIVQYINIGKISTCLKCLTILMLLFVPCTVGWNDLLLFSIFENKHTAAIQESLYEFKFSKITGTLKWICFWKYLSFTKHARKKIWN